MTIAQSTNLIIGMLLAGFTLQWLEVGPLPIAQISYLSIPCLLCVRSPRALVAKEMDLYRLYFCFLAVLVLGLMWSNDLAAGSTAVLRGFVYAGLAIVLYAWTRSYPDREIETSLSRAVYYVLPVFAAAFAYSAQKAGVNILDVLIRSFSSGNPNILQYQIFTVTLNNGEIDSDGYSSAARHGIMISLMTVAHLHLMLRDESTRIGTALCAIVYVLVFFSLSRSAILGLVLGYGCVALKQVATGTFPYRFMFLASTALFLLGASTGAIDGTGAGSILQEKFVSDVADNPRVHEFFQIIDIIDDGALIGAGTGTGLTLKGLGAQYPHNFVLYGWHQVGILGFLMTSCFTILVLLYLGVSVNRSIRLAHIDKSASRAYSLCAMCLCIVFVRLMFAKAGLLALPEWVALTLAARSFWSAKRRTDGSYISSEAPDRLTLQART